MKALISFCNTQKTTPSNLLLLDLLKGEKHWIKIGIANHGITGITQDNDFFYALFQAQKPGIAIINRRPLKTILTQELPELKDPHSIAVKENSIFIVSSGTDQVLEYTFDKASKKISFSKVFWAPKDSAQTTDTHHINSIFIKNEDTFISAFGPKLSERWSSAKNGYIFNINKNKKVVENIFHPHSATANRDSYLYCESSSKCVKKNKETIIKLKTGYTRGLAIDRNYLLLGTSSGRKTSKSTGIVNNPSDPGELIEDCRLIVFKRNLFGKYNKLSEFSFLPDNREIYDILSVSSTLRWRIAMFPYKFYLEKIKKYIPKSAFIAWNKLLNDFPKFIIHKIRTSTPARIFKKYYHLAIMAFEEYRVNGWKDLKFAIKRHWKKRKGTLIVPYATSNDFRKNLVSIGILTINRLDLIKPCIESIEKNLSQKYEVEILIGDTGSTEKEVWDFYKKAQKKYKNIKVIKFKGYFFSKNYNDLLRRLAKGEFLILLNNDTIAKKNWIDNFIDPLKDKRIGIVGGKLLYKNETIQHAGVEFNKNRNGIHVFSEQNKSIPEASYKAIVPSVTFAAVAMRHDVFNRFKLSEDFKEEAQDTDLCFRLDEAGFKVLYNPEAEIYHLENSTRNWKKGESDRKLFDKRWGSKINTYLNKENQRESFDENYYKDAIVVIRDDGIGDLLMGVSAFHSLRKKYPDKKLVLLTYERNVEMMDGFKIFDEVLPIPNGQKYAPLPIPTKDTTVFNLINIEMNFGKARATTKEANKIPRHTSFTQALELSNEFELVKIPNYSEAKNNVLNTLTEIGIDHQKNDFVVFNLSSTNPARSWWGPYYPSLIKAVEKLGFTPLIVGTEESPYFQGEKIVNLVGKTKNIQEYIEAIKLGKYVISTDTSAYHIAALAEIPFLAIFTGGVTPESRLSFYSKYEYLEPKGLSCYPCWDEGCKDPNLYWKKDPCRLIIKPEQAIEKFKELINKY